MSNVKKYILGITLLCNAMFLGNQQLVVSAETTSATTVTEATTVTTTTTTPVVTTVTTTPNIVDTTTVDIDVNIITMPNGVLRVQAKLPTDMIFGITMNISYNDNAIKLLSKSSELVNNGTYESENTSVNPINFSGTNYNVTNTYEYFFEADFEILNDSLDDNISIEVTKFQEVLGANDFLDKNTNINITRTVAREYLLGDTNLDGTIDITDAILTLQYMDGSVSRYGNSKDGRDFNYDGVVDEKDSLFIGDVNSDGKIDITDAVSILQYTTKEITIFRRKEIISSTVKDGNGNPIEGVTIEYVNSNTGTKYGSTTSNASGDFSISAREGDYTLTFTKEGYGTVSKPVTIDGYENTIPLDSDVIMYPTVDDTKLQVSGSILDSAEQPLLGVSVTFTNIDTDETFSAYSDELGVYNISLASGDYELTFSLEGYDTQTQSVTVSDEDLTLDNVTLEQTKYSVSGTVVDEDGNPLEGVVVSFVDFNTCDDFETTTDENGKFSIELSDGEYYIDFTLDNYFWEDDEFELEAFTIDGDTTFDNIVLKSYVTYEISGKVVDEDGNPLNNVVLSIYYDDLLNGMSITNEDGEYSIELASGDYELTFSLEGYDTQTQSVTVNDVTQSMNLGNTVLSKSNTPTVNDIATFLNSAYDYDSNYCTIYDGTTSDGFNMNNVTYHNGLVFSNDSLLKITLSSSFNVESLDSLSFKVGHIDNTAMNDVTLNIYLDGELAQTESISATGLPQTITLDTSNASKVTFEFKSLCNDGTSYAIGDFSIDGSTNEIEPVSPTYVNNISEEDYNTLVNDMISAVNAYRAENGLTEYKTSTVISELAKQRASEQETTGMSHTRPDGSTFSTVFTENAVSYSSCGENASISYSSLDAMVDDVLGRWKASEGHNANILGNYEYIGVSVGYYDGTYYWIQLFYSGNDSKVTSTEN